MFKKQPQTITDLLNSFLRDNSLETPLLQRKAINAWDKIAGKAICKYTMEKSIRNQTLFIKISSPALRNNLVMMKSDLVNKINHEVGNRIINDIRFY